MSLEQIIAQIQALPETEALPELFTVFEHAKNEPHSDWQLPLVACRAVGGDEQTALPGAAAVACMMISIMLVDDILDEDPRGEHLRRGYGQTANLSLAFQAAAFRLVERTPVSYAQQAAVTTSLAHMALKTAAGQILDIGNFSGEENYWKVVRTKSSPFYGAALQIGAILGGADKELACHIYELGSLIGEIIQIEDDFTDAFETPANADWVQGRNNLLILYALTADHPQQSDFKELLPGIKMPATLKEAQEILFSSGAASYCVYQLIHRYQAAHRMLDNLTLVNPAPIRDILKCYGDSLTKMLGATGFDLTPETLVQYTLS